MRDFDIEIFGIVEGGVDELRIRKQVTIRRYVPGLVSVNLFDIQYPEQSVPCLELEDQKITRLEFMDHLSKLA